MAAQYEYTMCKEMDLKAEQDKTLQTPVMTANIVLRIMYLAMDLVYGSERSLPKFKVVASLARYPYWAWENGSYHRLSRRYARAKYTAKKASEEDLRHIELGRRIPPGSPSSSKP